MNIAIVEDDSLTALFIQETLEDLGYQVVGSFESALPLLDKASDLDLDLVFMDIEIHGCINGIECAAKLQNKNQVSSIFITSYQDSSTINDAMDASPLGYLIKPVNENEIEAALAVSKKILQANKPVADEVLSLGDYTYHFKDKVLKHDDDLVKLSKNEYKIIDLLCKSYGNIVENEELIRNIWEDEYNRDSSLRELIYRLRKKLPELSILSSSKIGYSLTSRK